MNSILEIVTAEIAG